MERRIKISPIFLLILAVLLAVIIGVSLWLNNDVTDDADGMTVTICQDGSSCAGYSLEGLMELEKTTIHADLQSAEGTDVSGEYTGVMLDQLLKDAEVDQYQTIVLTAGDHYSAAADADEAAKILIAYEREGESLGYYTKGGTGPVRAIFVEDTYGNRSVQYLVKIDCRS